MPAVDEKTAEFLTQQKALSNKGKGKGKLPEEKFYGSGKGRETRTGPDGFNTEKNDKDK